MGNSDSFCDCECGRSQHQSESKSKLIPGHRQHEVLDETMQDDYASILNHEPELSTTSTNVLKQEHDEEGDVTVLESELDVEATIDGDVDAGVPRPAVSDMATPFQLYCDRMEEHSNNLTKPKAGLYPPASLAEVGISGFLKQAAPATKKSPSLAAKQPNMWHIHGGTQQ